MREINIFITRNVAVFLNICIATSLLFFNSCKINDNQITIVPFTLDHNRILVNAEIQKKDGSPKKILLWVDTGNPEFLISSKLALELGFISDCDSTKAVRGELEINTPIVIRAGEMTRDYSGAKSIVIFKPFWVFKETYADATIPSTVLMRYDVAFDYPAKEMTISKPGGMKFSGIKIPININPTTGILQIDGMLEKDSISFALDNGASFTFGSTEFLESLKNKNPDLPLCKGAVGCANMWGWGYKEDSWTVTRIPQMNFGNLTLKNTVITIPPDYNDKGYGIMDWYSKKTFKPVHGFLGPNAFIDFKVGIDYTNKNIYFERKQKENFNDMNIVGITLRPETNGNYTIIGVASKNVIPLVDGIQSGDLLIQINDSQVKDKSMGKVIDALRGKPGEIKNLTLERKGERVKLTAEVQSIL